MLRLQRGRRRPGRQRGLAGAAARARCWREAGPTRRRRHGALDQRRRLDRRRRRWRRSPTSRDALLAVGDERRAAAARARVPGADGGARAVRLRLGDKWVVDLEVTRFDRDDGVLDDRAAGPSAAPVKTASRIDVPGAGRPAAPGRVAVAGVAWAQHRRDRRGRGAASTAARGRTPGSPARSDLDTWRQWVFEWDATTRPAHARGPRDRRRRPVQTGERSPRRSRTARPAGTRRRHA